MDEVNGQNSNGNGHVYVKFGPRDTEEMRLEWAEKMLTLWKDRNPAQFGKMLAEVVTGSH
jgi:hypothetical protein